MIDDRNKSYDILVSITDRFNELGLEFVESQDKDDLDGRATAIMHVLIYARMMDDLNKSIQDNPLTLHLKSTFGGNIEDLFNRKAPHGVVQTVNKEEYKKHMEKTPSH